LKDFCCILKYTHDMAMNFEYVVWYNMLRLLTKDDVFLMSRELIMIYVSLCYYKLDAFYSHF
jgi:hypothetical protein